MSKNVKYENTTGNKQKVYTDGVTGPFVFLEPGDTCTVRIDADQKVRVLDVEPRPEPEPEPKPEPKKPAAKK